mmetsp:Transcript_63546/g.184314  ORF Transcript_63546/g.184314 Transcript_63546/m.184314 type:complete len:210 (-) Transcript_63546:1129-1758(-)
MRCDNSKPTWFLLRYRRSFQNSFAASSFMARNCVKDPVMLPTRYEKPTRAKITTQIVTCRSVMFLGFTFMEAGVNCVIDQWKLVKYWSCQIVSLKPYSSIQFASPKSMRQAPTAYHKHAIKWFIPSSVRIIFTIFAMILAASESRRSLMMVKIQPSFSSRNRRIVRASLRIRKSFTALPPPSSPLVRDNTVKTQSGTTTSKSIQNQPVK